MPLDENIAGLLSFMQSSGTPAISDGSVEEAREALRTLLVHLRDPATLPPCASIVDETVAGSVPVRVYRPAAAAQSATGHVPTIVYFHGGGWVIGDLDTHDGVCRALSRDVGAVVVSVGYRLAPEHRFPAAVEDSYAALRHVIEHLGDYGSDPARVVVGGDSAGGNLAAVCAQLARADGLPLAAQLLVYPAVDLLGDFASREENAEGYFLTLADMKWFAAHYTGIDEDAASPDDPEVAAIARDTRLSPLLADSLEGLPPAIVATAEFDPLRDEGNAYAAALEKAGVRVEHQQFAGLIHGFYGLEQISPAVADASAWVNHQLVHILADVGEA